MSRGQKMDILRIIESASLSTSEALAKFDIPRSTYYRWKRKFLAMGLKAHRGQVMQKLEVESVAELVRLAEKAGISPAQYKPDL